MSGKYLPPDGRDVSSPVIQLAIHPIGGMRKPKRHLPCTLQTGIPATFVLAGFCAISKTLPLPPSTEIDGSTGAVESNGLNAAFGETAHCIAAEPDTTFLRVSVADGKHEVAYETLVLGRLRHGYRVLTLRHVSTGTRIELAYLFVRISFGTVPKFAIRVRTEDGTVAMWRCVLLADSSVPLTTVCGPQLANCICTAPWQRRATRSSADASKNWKRWYPRHLPSR